MKFRDHMPYASYLHCLHCAAPECKFVTTLSRDRFSGAFSLAVLKINIRSHIDGLRKAFARPSLSHRTSTGRLHKCRFGLGAAVAGSQLSGPVNDSHPHNPITLITMAVGVRFSLSLALTEAPYSFIAAPAKLIRPQWHPHL
jgi:hypothetical protein